MIKKVGSIIILACTAMGILYADETSVNNEECKRCSLRPRPNTQPYQYEYYEDYRKAVERGDVPGVNHRGNENTEKS